MGRVSAELVIGASLAEVWDLYFEPRGWATWVDEFASVDSIGDGYPEIGGKLVWHSGAAGRGRVEETVLDHEPRRLHRIHFADPHAEGEQLTTFEIAGAGTKVRIELVYGLMAPGVFGPITDRLFIRSQMRAMLTRTLEGLRAEARELASRGTAS
jgi:polyketide cyclase/dehydrase/lipid transport protein